MVDEHAVHALLDGMEESDVLAVHLDDNARVPAISVLVVP